MSGMDREVKRVYRFGILGCGMIANLHASAINSLPDATLAGVADSRAESAASFADRYGVKAYESYGSMLDDPEIDVVCVCTPSGFHAENAIAALEKGKHVVLEKPMAITVADADSIVETCEKTGRMLTVISQLRFSQDVAKVKKLVSEGAFGRITLCSLRMKYYRSREYYSASWKGTKRLDGGGALMNQGVHGVDLLQYVVGGIKGVEGRIATLSHSIEVEDTAVATLEFENGALGVIEASTCAHPGFERVIEIHGDRGYVKLVENSIERLILNGENVAVAKSDSVGTANDPTQLDFKMHAVQIGELVSAIKGEGKLTVDCREGKKAVEIIEKIYRSNH